MSRRLAFVALLALAAPATAPAQCGSVSVGLLRGADLDPSCDEPLGPSRAEMFVVWFDPRASDRSLSPAAYVINRTRATGELDWDERSGAFHVLPNIDLGSIGSTFVVVATFYPPGEPPGAHHGFLAADTPVGQSEMGTTLVQPVPAPRVVETARGNELTWPPLPRAGAAGTCDLGQLSRPIPGYDVYRLSERDVPREISSPDHYLCGPDLDCRTPADNGWLAFVPNTPSPRDGLIHFTDPATGTRAREWVYVIQPVVWGTTPDARDRDGDTILDHDLDGDGVDEFVDPSNTGLGLTGRIDLPGGGFLKRILISPDASLDDTRIRIRKRAAGGLDVTWERAPGATAHDLYAADLGSLPGTARDILACDLPPGPGARPLDDPGGAGRPRTYLMSSVSAGAIRYGTDSFLRERAATTTLPGCR